MRRAKRNAAKVLLYAVLSLWGLIIVFPYVFMLSKSLMTGAEVTEPVPILFPSVPQWRNYVEIFTRSGYGKGLLYTVFIIVFNCIAVCMSASAAAFAFTRLKWFGKKVLFALTMSTLMLPGLATQIPLYVLFNSFGWINTVLPLTVPSLFGGGAVYIFLLRQFMLALPADLDNAARIDGASAFRRYLQITLPLCRPVLIFILINVFMTYWGDFYGPLIYMPSSDAPRTLAYLIFVDATSSDAAAYNTNIRMAAGVFMSFVPAVLFFVFQRQLIEGVSATGLKG